MRSRITKAPYLVLVFEVHLATIRKLYDEVAESGLLEARRLLRTSGASVTTAAFDVGYESPSQFSREYARKFGVPPSHDMANGAG